MVLAVCLFLLSTVYGMYDSPYIQDIPYHALRTAIEQTNFLSLSIVYDEEGDKSRKLEPIILKTAETYKSFIRVNSINCYSDPERCTPSTRTNLPGVMASYYAGTDPISKEKKVFQETFLGSLTVKGLGDFILSNLPFFGTVLTYRNLDWFLSQEALSKVFLFTDKDQIPSLYKGMTSEFRGKLDFAVVWKNQTDIVEQYGVRWFPTLFVLTKEKRVEYDGDLKFEDLQYFLTHYTSSEAISDRFLIKSPIETEPATHLTPQTYRKSLSDLSKPAAVYFYLNRTEAEWEQFKVAYRGMIELYEMELSKEEMRTEFLLAEGINKLPALKIQFVGNSQGKLVDLSSADQLIKENTKYEMLKLDPEVPKTYLEHMKRLGKLGAVFVTEGEPNVQYKALSKDPYLKDAFVFGVYTNETVQKFVDLFKLKRAPTLVSTYSVRGEEVQFREFPGDLSSYSQMRYFLEDLMIPLFHNETQLSPENWKDEEVEELNSKSFGQYCLKKASFCLIAVFEGADSLLKTKANRELMTAMKKAQTYGETKSRPYRFGFIDGDCEFEFRKTLGIREKDLPALVAYQGVKNLVFRFSGDLTETNVRLFMDRAAFDKEKGENAIPELSDRDCKFYRQEMKRLTKEQPEATKKALSQAYLDLEQQLREAGKAPTKKHSRRKSDL